MNGIKIMLIKIEQKNGKNFLRKREKNIKVELQNGKFWIL